MNAKIKEAIETISRELNGGNHKDIALTIVDTVRADHRTLQEYFWSVMLLAQIMYADSRYDLRNEAAVKLAGLVKQLAIDNDMDMGLPRI
jgi:hypothetical protein